MMITATILFFLIINSSCTLDATHVRHEPALIVRNRTIDCQNSKVKRHFLAIFIHISSQEARYLHLVLQLLEHPHNSRSRNLCVNA